MNYIDILKQGNTPQLRQLSETGRANIEYTFKGFPTPPQYAQDITRVADWDIAYQNTHDGALGYFLPVSPIKEGIALLKNQKTWMSITPLEIESAMLPQYAAKGNVVVAGLGLGMIANSLLNKPSVRKLTVLEYDKKLIDNYDQLLKGDSRRRWLEALDSGRLQLIECDCTKSFSRELRQKIGTVDYLWADIWPDLGTAEALTDTKHLCRQLNPRKADYWGMELDLLSEMQNRNLPVEIGSVIKVFDKLSIPCSPLTMQKQQRRFYAELVIMAGGHLVMASMLKKKPKGTL